MLYGVPIFPSPSARLSIRWFSGVTGALLRRPTGKAVNLPTGEGSGLVSLPLADDAVKLSVEERDNLLNVVSPLEHPSPTLDPQVPTTGYGTAPTFTLYANEPLVKLVPRLSSRGKLEDLVVNVVMRAVDAQRTKEPIDRVAAVDQLQSELYVAISLMLDRHFAHPKSHHIFALLNRDLVKRVAPKIKRKQYQLVKDMVYQPLLRFGMNRSGNIAKFDPNFILEAAGPYGFMTVYKKLPMDVTKLTGPNFDTIMSCRLNKHEHVTFDGVSLLLAMRPTDFREPVAEDSQWSLKRVIPARWFKVIEASSVRLLKRSAGDAVLICFGTFSSTSPRKLRAIAKGAVWRECVDHLRSRDPDTGLLLDQWAYETVTTIVWEAAGSIDRETNEARMIEAPRYEDFQGSDDEELHETEMVVWDESTTDALESVDNTDLPFDELLPLSEERIYLVSSPAQLAAMYRRMRRELEEHNSKLADLGSPSSRDWLVALNYEENEAEDDIPFPPSLFTIATPSATYVIDISCLHSDIMSAAGFQTTLKFTLDWLLKEPTARKVCMVFTNLLQRLNTLMYGFKGDPSGTQLAVDEEEDQLDWNDSEQIRAYANDELRASNWAADRDVGDMRKIKYTNVVDLRQRRIRKVERWKENGITDPAEVAEMMLQQEDITEAIAKAREHEAVARGASSVPASLSHEIELHGGLMSSRALLYNYVAKEDSTKMILTPGEPKIRRRDINWDFRPLSAAAVLLSAEDAYVLMLIEHRMTRRLDIHSADSSFPQRLPLSVIA
ncbi:hypothetical protein FOZ60_016207 [Perkinsus olseni]|uniref:Uncharacterized protein n=1 Tax=Perkinsus olseni TaxID=32597 RepID=A0A7J6P4M0_PEROL|nr:hypothetical protein FOZ60_016207 [Perkinsus olseni]